MATPRRGGLRVNAFDPVAADARATLRPGVTLAGVDAAYGPTAALRGIDLDVAPGEFVALVGPSGAGKTTLLRVIAGLEPLTAGRLAIGARDVTTVPARARNIGFVFQNYALFGHMSVAENVAFGLRVRPRAVRPGRRAIAARVRELLELVQVAEFASRRPAQLSGGQRQRVALARALATDPALLLLDEPFGALDPLVRKEIRSWLRGLHDRLGLTSILVTHDQGEAIEVADRIVVLEGGRVAQVGTPEALEQVPASDFVHRFLGERVAFDGTVEDARTVRLDGAGTARVRPDARLPGAGRVRLSLRPWEIGVAVADSVETGDGPAGRVAALHRAGPHLRVRVVLGEGPRAVDILVPADRAPPRGARVTLDLRRARVFPLAS